MKALMLTSSDGPQAAGLADVEDHDPGPGEVKVALGAASLNHRELWISRGLYPAMALPTILGADGAGRIVATGDGVDRSEIGRQVVLYPALDWGNCEAHPAPGFGLLGMPGPGTIAETVCVPIESAFPRPEHLNAAEAAALPVAALTAYRALTVKGRLTAGERLLVTGIGGGVATFAMLFGKAMGAQVFVTSGSEEKLAAARHHGVEAAFDYRDEAWGKTLRRAAGEGIHVVLDGAPAAGFASYVRSLAPGARVVLYGSTAGAQFTASAPDLFLRHASILGTAMGSPRDFASMLDFIASHRLRPIIDRIFPLAQAREALLYLDQGRHFGKVVIDIGETG